MSKNFNDQSGRNNIFSQSQIEEIATKLRERMNISLEEVVDITELCELMGIDIYEVDFEDKSILGSLLYKDELNDLDVKSLQENEISLEESGDMIIYIDEDLAEGDKRYIIATQLAHILLGHHKQYQANEYLTEYRETFKGCTTSDQYGIKIQAMLLALSLLMPEVYLVPFWDQFKSIDLVAEKFKVSKKVAILRLDNLGLI